ncbi:hypothetical protein Val02_47970 [Virgisporangium aliadipatigenens]|uniref:Threonine/serine exporter-like N-terminal domain-containing protein n=1 Tax=Virgisporangium aliadipatigenens TaxID=741659 RepID=A0A8J3YMF1_9ACTN|nr:threonine/serine exporter family protein [Virgisporangium aliadipatigenens]GIJ47911.1 hypothetical protein Val02_47970 [Virgisporangium aliadipatigenens]
MAEPDAAALHAFVVEVGRALNLAGTAVSETQERLMRIAAANHAGDARIIVLPTAIVITLGPAGPTSVEAVPRLSAPLRLDQVSALYDIVTPAESGALDPVEGLRRVRAIRDLRPRYGRLLSVLGYTAMTVGLCLMVGAAPAEIGVMAGLGAVVAVLVRFARGRRSLVLLVPVVSAVLVSALTFQAVRSGIADPGLRTLIVPLMTFLPGSALTTATVELASGEMVSGASRVVWGTFQLLLLAFGIVAGADLVGLSREDIDLPSPGGGLGWWAPWVGLLVFGVAVAVHFSAPRGALRWLLVVLLAAWLGRLLGDRIAGAAVSGFLGALAMTPVALAVSRLPGGPPSQVTFLPAFWLLVPGAGGLVGVTRAVADPTAANPQDLVQPLASVIAIALGVLCGASLYRGLAGRRGR